MEQIDDLYQISDMSQDEFDKLKEQYLPHGQTVKIAQRLAGRSIYPRLRNTQIPPGELYAPIYYDADLMLKLVTKPSWGGHILAVAVWDMLVIDIDEEELENVEKNIMRLYHDDLFYINKTSRGFHLYLVSRPVRHSSKAAIYMRIKLNADPAHGTNSLYTGCSIRVSRKKTDTQELPSVFLKTCGNGTADQTCVALYDRVQKYIMTYGKWEPDAMNLDQLTMDWYGTIKLHYGNFGLLHVMTVAPQLLVNGQLISNDHVISPKWSKFIKYRVYHNGRGLLDDALRCMSYNNLYRIFEETPDYATGVHLQESCYFISYRDLFFVDIDHKSRLQLIYQYCRYHPDATFRVTRTNKGYHAFLTSKAVNHEECIDLYQRLGGDPLHMVSAFHRGYSVRLNPKVRDEQAYCEVRRIGTGTEDIRLYELYLLHLDLNKKHQKCEFYLYQQTTSRDIMSNEGII
jgi:hypothetical protein